MFVSRKAALIWDPSRNSTASTYRLTIDEVPLELVAIPKFDLSFRASSSPLYGCRRGIFRISQMRRLSSKRHGSSPVSLPFDVAWTRLTASLDNKMPL